MMPNDLVNYFYELIPIIRVSYIRRYFKDKINNIMLTLDTSISAIPLKPESKFNFVNLGNLFNYCILEVKYPLGIKKDNLKLMNEIPFVLTRHSKYISSLELFNLI